MFCHDGQAGTSEAPKAAELKPYNFPSMQQAIQLLLPLKSTRAAPAATRALQQSQQGASLEKNGFNPKLERGVPLQNFQGCHTYWEVLCWTRPLGRKPPSGFSKEEQQERSLVRLIQKSKRDCNYANCGPTSASASDDGLPGSVLNTWYKEPLECCGFGLSSQ